jgi:desulfoferrodoxin (superoxide reductase-like protein)
MFLIFASFSCLVEKVYADVPTVIQIENLSQGTFGKIRIQIRHANPTSGHYVDQVEIFGRKGGASGSKTIPLQPQSSNPFTVEVGEEIGVSLNDAYVKVRAHCNLHGWSNWSDEVPIPEFQHWAPAIALVMVASTLILRKRK